MVNVDRIERPGTLQSIAYGRIKGLLVSGELRTNLIYSASQFAEMLGVSRTPVREALLQLSAEGFLIAVQGRGFRVREFSIGEVRDFFEARLMIETYILGRLGGTVSEESLQGLQESLDQMIRCAGRMDSDGFLEADKAFHMNLVHRHKNRFLALIMENIRNLISILGRKALATAGRSGEVIEEHRRVLEAIKRRDAAGAAKAMRHHLSTTENTIIDTL